LVHVTQVVGSTDQMDVDDTTSKCKLYVGSQALGFRRDHMEVSFLVIFLSCF
jgi:hypothetical protein